MFKDILLEQQPVVYHTLKNALETHKVAHAYMFSGPNGTPKKETAYFLAQSLLCEQEEGFACETCDTCKRVVHNEYADMIYLDGTLVSIKKDEILKLQHTFSKTGLEANGKKVYILDHAENATPDALNSLLKFLEEPTNDMVAILLVEQIDRVLPTIVSRCQNIPFTALNAKQCYEAIREELNELDAYLLSHMIRQKKDIMVAVESEDYQHAIYVFKGMIERYESSPYEALLFLQTEGFPTKQKKYGKQALNYLIEILTLFFRDCLKQNKDIHDDWYLKHLMIMQSKQIDNVKILQILMQTKDKLLRSVNIQLLVEQMLYQMKEVSK
ncbi:MAG: DNA polymerase III subunit delta [Longicatena sp.]